MKTFTIVALFTALASVCLGQETFPGATFTSSTLITGLDKTANLTLPFATISGTILQRSLSSGNGVLPATRQEGLWSTPPAIATQLTPFGDYQVNGTTVVKFKDFKVADRALIDLRLGVKGGPGVVPNILFTVSYTSLCSAIWTITGDATSWIYKYQGLVC